MKFKIGLIGYPLSHSLSPLIHNYWIKKYNLNAEYNLIETKPEDLDKLCSELFTDGYIGYNVTAPFKEMLYKRIASIGYIPYPILNTVNTLWKDQDYRIVLSNTDHSAFYENVINNRFRLLFVQKKVVIIGSGAVAKMVACNLAREGVSELVIVSRSEEKTKNIFNYINGNFHSLKLISTDFKNLEDVLENSTLLVNCTPLGSELQFSLENLPEDALVVDYVYNPVKTPILKEAKKRGNPVVDGIELLLSQAAKSFDIWFKIHPTITDELLEMLKKE